MYKVIVADDEPFMLEGWRTMIDWRACGYELCGTATDGEEALALFNSVEPDLVVTDIQMPVMDGLGLIHTLREDLAYTSKIVIVTGYPILITRSKPYGIRSISTCLNLLFPRRFIKSLWT